jgi:hypothetical protein
MGKERSSGMALEEQGHEARDSNGGGALLHGGRIGIASSMWRAVKRARWGAD